MKVSDLMVRDVKLIGKELSVSKALAVMKAEHIKELPVVSSGKLVGLLTLHSIVTFPNYDSDLKVSKIIFRPALLKEDDEFDTAILLMKDAGVRGLPVVRGSEVVGFISDYDLLKVLTDELKGLTVNDLINPVSSFLQLSDDVARAKRLLHYGRTSSLPVVDAANKLVGVLDEDDLIPFLKPRESMSYGVEGSGDSLKFINATVGDVISKEYFNGVPGMPLADAVNLMLDNHLPSLIIVDDANEPIGIVERFDILNRIYENRNPRGVVLNFTGLKIDFVTNSQLTKVVYNHLSRVNYLAKSIKSINVRVKGVHAGSGVRKFDVDLKVVLTSGVTERVSKVGYSLPKCLDEALTDIAKIMKKNYKKINP